MSADRRVVVVLVAAVFLGWEVESVGVDSKLWEARQLKGCGSKGVSRKKRSSGQETRRVRNRCGVVWW
jgi:hypothetical protein